MKATSPLYKVVARVAGRAAGALLGFAVLASTVQAQALYSPTGTIWDCVLGGKGQKGIAFVTFLNDYTFSGYQILSGVSAPIYDIDGRNPGGDVGRDYDPFVGPGKTNVFVYGFDQFTGRWGYDSRGRVIGSFMEITSDESEGVDTVTNTVSFIAKVVPGKRLNLVSHGVNGKIAYRGVPYVQNMPSLNGNWYATKKMNGQWFVDFYTLTSTADANPWAWGYSDLSDYPGIYYTLDGQGGAYDFAGFCLLSCQKKVAFAFESFSPGATNTVLSATFGSFSNSKGVLKAATKGNDPVNGKISYSAMQSLGGQ